MPHASLTFGIVVDVVAVMTFVFFLSRGIMRGISGELACVAGFVGGAWASYAFYPKIQSMLPATSGTTPPFVLAMITLFLSLLAGFLVGWVIRYLCATMMQVVILQPADAILGFAAGVVYATAFLLVLFALAMLVPIQSIQRLFSDQSLLGRHVCPWLRDHMGLPK
jgi:uncharacterized membrane protein required for colicin V production